MTDSEGTGIAELPFARVWAPWWPERVLYRDADFCVLDKPAGVSCQSATTEHCDDVYQRWRLYTQQNPVSGLVADDLGVHQRLDQMTSGVMLLTSSAAAHASMAKQFATKQVKKRYRVIVGGAGRLTKGQRINLEHFLLPRHRGYVRTTSSRHPAARQANLRAEVLQVAGDYAHLRVQIDQGRTHQIRVQLAAAGYPVVGDRLYGSVDDTSPSPLLLHAESLACEHPIQGGLPTFQAPLPPLFDAWMQGGTADDVFRDASRLHYLLFCALQLRWGLAHTALDQAQTTAFRLVNGVNDALPGLVIDLYAGTLHIQVMNPQVNAALPLLQEQLRCWGFDHHVVACHREAGAPSTPSSIVETKRVYEQSLPYQVYLGAGLGTGLYVDQRDNRKRVQDFAKGKRVLNLFAYHGAFAIAAAAGGAIDVVNVDASKTALRCARANVEQLVDASTVQHFYAGDVFAELARAQRRAHFFDLLIVDPPTYSTNKRSQWRNRRDWPRLAEACLNVAAPNAYLLICSHDRGMSWQELERLWHRVADSAQRPLHLRRLKSPRDQRGLCDVADDMKSLWIELNE